MTGAAADDNASVTLAAPGDRGHRRLPVLEDLPDPSGRRALVRATFDRPLTADPASPLALRRARGLAGTVEWLRDRGAQVTVCGDTAAPDEATAGRQLALLRRAVEEASSGLSPHDASLEFCGSPEEPEAVHRLAAVHDLFVNDTLQDSYLPLPSLILPPAQLPAAVGRTLEGDLRILDALLVDPVRPFVVVLGGARSFDRLRGLQGLVLRADTVLLGGALALPMLQALGEQPLDGGTEPFLWECRSVLGLAQRVRHQLVLPVDLVWRHAGGWRVTPATERAGGEVVDIGPTTRLRFAEVIEGARTVLWAGALGRVEEAAFAAGTETVGASLTGPAVVLGGDALAATLHAARLLPPSAEMVSATDAAVELLKSGDLPALAVLRRH